MVSFKMHFVLIDLNLGTSTVPVASGETSRKRTADEEPDADVPSASRRRRSTNTDPSYIRPTFPACCANGSFSNFLTHPLTDWAFQYTVSVYNTSTLNSVPAAGGFRSFSLSVLVNCTLLPDSGSSDTALYTG